MIEENIRVLGRIWKVQVHTLAKVKKWLSENDKIIVFKRPANKMLYADNDTKQYVYCPYHTLPEEECS